MTIRCSTCNRDKLPDMFPASVVQAMRVGLTKSAKVCNMCRRELNAAKAAKKEPYVPLDK